MAKVSVYNLEKKPVGEFELSDAVFGAEVNEALIALKTDAITGAGVLDVALQDAQSEE